MNQRPLIAVVLMSVLMVAGCRHFPNDPVAPLPPVIQGDYVGSGGLEGNATNVSLAITGPDSMGNFSGLIGYRGMFTPLLAVTQDSTGDTLRFQYWRNNVQHSAWALVDASGLAVHFTIPANTPEFRLNRAFGGYNMSGIWHGNLYSYALQQPRTTTMTMEQEGSIFIGSFDVNLLQNAHVQISSGGYNRNSFQLTGIMRYNGTDYPFQANGSYVNVDSVSGIWQSGNNGALDQGTLNLSRAFE